MGDNSLLIAQGLLAMLAGATDPTTSQPVYAATKLGAFFDPSPYTSFAEVVDPIGRLGHAGSGGDVVGWRVEDTLAFKINSGWRYDQDSTAAMTSFLTARSVVLPMFASHYQIPNPNTPSVPIPSVFSLLEDDGQTDRAMPIRFPQGQVYLVWTFWVTAKQQYSVTLSTP